MGGAPASLVQSMSQRSEVTKVRGLVRFAAVGILRIWASMAVQGHAAIPRPRDAPTAHSPGLDSDRVLIFGSGPAAGWGVSSHDLALPGALARALSACTLRGADVRLVASPMGAISAALDQLVSVNLRRVNAVVVVIGVDDAIHLTAEGAWRRDLRRLLHYFEQQTSESTHIYVQGIQPIRAIPLFDSWGGAVANRHARSLNTITEQVCQSVPRCVFVSVDDAPFLTSTRLRDSTDYRRWGQFLATKMAGNLDQPRRVLAPVPSILIEAPAGSEASNDGLIRRNISEIQIRLDHIVALTQQSFGTASAAFVVKDVDRLRVRSSAGPVSNDIVWADSISAIVVRSTGAVIVPDIRVDERVRQRAPGQGLSRIRFGAGFPIESPSGERIGALCVFDPLPRSPASVDSVLLRQLALMIQDELYASGEFAATAN